MSGRYWPEGAGHLAWAIISATDPYRTVENCPYLSAGLNPENKNGLGKIVATAIAVAVLGVAALLYSLSDKAPPLESLSVVSGALHSYEEARTGTRNSSKTPRFKLGESDKLFQYVSKGGKLGAVSSALRGARGKVVEVYVDEANPFSPPLNDIEIYTVYAVSIEGVAIREYDDVAAAWNSDSKIGVIVGAFFILAGLTVGVIVVLDRLRSE